MNLANRYKQLSKFLSLVLRHNPTRIGLELDDQGWVSFPVLLQQLAQTDLNTTREELLAMIAANDKQRFTYDADQDRIRAAQGHTVEVTLGYEASTPPARLYHGTVAPYIPGIKSKGLLPIKRHQVHLSPDIETATKVGNRRGEAIILTVLAGPMHEHGLTFCQSTNGVWLTDHVPPEYIHFPEQ